MIDIEQVRGDTVGVGHVVHLNNCGSSLPPTAVVDAQIEYLRDEQRIGGYEAVTAHQQHIDEMYALTARLLNCAPNEVAFQGSASEAWWRAFTSIPLAAGDRVLCGRSEFQANGYGLLQAEARGIAVDVIPNDEHGTIDLDALRAAIDDRVQLVCLTQISMSNGAVHPADAVGEMCREADVPFLLDACQVAGQRPIDVQAAGCDFLVYTGRKFLRGPRGTGILYAKNETVDRLGPTGFVDGRSALWTSESTWEHAPGAQRFEFGERSYAALVGLAEATRYALEVGLENIADRVNLLADGLRAQLAGVPGVTVRDEGTDRCGIVTFTVDRHPPAGVQATLSAQGINVGAPGRQNAQWDLGTRNIEAVVRVGVHYFNTVDETAQLVDAVHAIATSGSH